MANDDITFEMNDGGNVPIHDHIQQNIGGSKNDCREIC